MSLTVSIIIRRSQSVKVSGSYFAHNHETFVEKTHPLILGQWVVHHKVLLACGLAGVGNVLWQKKTKQNNNNAQQLVTTFDDLISDQFFPLMGCILCSVFQDISSYKFYIWMSSEVNGEHLYLRTTLATDGCSHHLLDLLILGPELLCLVYPLLFILWKNLQVQL